jgi:hypothetical protein
LLISALGVPLSLHELDLRHIREATFSAVRFAAIADPAQLSQLSVSHWEEVEGVNAAGVRQVAWGKYEMHVPRTTTTVVADVDLRPTLATLLLGTGGWLRVAAALLAGGLVFYVGMRRTTPSANKNKTPSTTPRPHSQDMSHTQAPLSLLKSGMDRITYPGLVLDLDHRLVVWNAALQNDAPDVTWSSDLHLLDLAEMLPWGKQLIEAVDDHSLRTNPEPSTLLLITNEGGHLCVTAG